MTAMKRKTTLSDCRKAIKQRNFLENFKQSGFLSDAAAAAGVSRQTVYYWKRTSPAFVSEMMEAQGIFERTGDGYRLAAISTLAQTGDRDMQNYIRSKHGPRILKRVMDGGMLTQRGLK